MLGFTTKKMTVKEFQKIQDNPIQRNTKRHALQSCRPNGHLATYSPTHHRVSIAETKGGKKRWLLDGHSRRYLWERGDLEEPNELLVDVYEVKNEAGAIDLYQTFDSQAATENGGDKIFGALKYHGLVPHTTLYRNAGMLSAMKYLVFPNQRSDLRNLSILELVEPWIKTLTTIDGSAHTICANTYFPSWVMMAMMLTVRRDQSIAMSFWEHYAQGEGAKSKKSMDGIFAARQLFDFVNDNRQNYVSLNGKFRECTTIVLHQYQCWHDNKRLPGQKQGVTRYGINVGQQFPPITKWWQENLGDYDFPQIRKQQGLDLGDD